VSVWAIIPAAGRGSRLGAGSPKQFLPLAGQPILARTLAVFEAVSAVDHVVVVVPPGDEGRCRGMMVEPYGFTKIRAIVPGGGSRQESVARGLDAIGLDASIVLVHDAARPLVTGDLVQRVIKAAAGSGAAVAALPVVDTLKRATGRDGAVMTVDREGLWTAQTPQAFRVAVFRDAVSRAVADGFVGTDDASLVERLGLPVTLVDGEPFNFKITRAEDVLLAEELLATRRTPVTREVPGSVVRSGLV
jgi:2-C-methyl-D-erythritol 4-phosphate cytidylyltransferase